MLTSKDHDATPRERATAALGSTSLRRLGRPATAQSEVRVDSVCRSSPMPLRREGATLTRAGSRTAAPPSASLPTMGVSLWEAFVAGLLNQHLSRATIPVRRQAGVFRAARDRAPGGTGVIDNSDPDRAEPSCRPPRRDAACATTQRRTGSNSNAHDAGTFPEAFDVRESPATVCTPGTQVG